MDAKGAALRLGGLGRTFRGLRSLRLRFGLRRGSGLLGNRFHCRDGKLLDRLRSLLRNFRLGSRLLRRLISAVQMSA